jgi:hypothetical protein
MFLLYNIVSDTMYSVVVCVDFLGTHMASLVCSLKSGATGGGWPPWSRRGIMAPTHRKSCTVTRGRVN